ncbi:SH2 domain-containing protein 1B [Geospiza fortis]|uniref:SH2 domain-containing protein 1B n=1 Tax=Geospiza fortis TaxID=48883 RepID=A0A6I9HN54_GEOFO|nr:SH2 domain-containing protein 1B [Geospiza fortis]XP_030813214.1 SH2 domain-containing protein 1B [Camarhynchus parvulus]
MSTGSCLWNKVSSHARLLTCSRIALKGKIHCFLWSMEFPFFHGKITRRTCEELLSKKKKNGSYLIRESESVEGALCLCVFFEDLIYTYRIFREHQGYFRIQTSEGVPERTFKTLKDLIYAFEKPNQGLITNLRYPVKKPKALQGSQRFKSGMDNVYDEVDDSADYVDVLP